MVTVQLRAHDMQLPLTVRGRRTSLAEQLLCVQRAQVRIPQLGPPFLCRLTMRAQPASPSLPRTPQHSAMRGAGWCSASAQTSGAPCRRQSMPLQVNCALPGGPTAVQLSGAAVRAASFESEMVCWSYKHMPAPHLQAPLPRSPQSQPCLSRPLSMASSSASPRQTQTRQPATSLC